MGRGRNRASRHPFAPHRRQFDGRRREHGVDRAIWEKAGAHGMLGLGVPEEFGGGGEPDYRYRFVFTEEIARTGFTSFGVGIGLQDDIVIPYFLDLATPEQKERWADAEVVAAAAHPHLTARGTLVEADGVVQAAAAPRFSRTRAPGIRPPRSMPDDVADVLADWPPTGATDLPTERQETR
ncbi:acyl-CoA dehydrogenase family protein [uncultured Microbacterium sp.]|uniref:acyl-CoA dehydrogenase family protein n=1 Tax=uncultured Microbacterium sp. TaxID=191216 RepID=UPI003458420E